MTIFDEMVAALNPQNAAQQTNAKHEVMHWKTRVKGRDWYDFEWYVANKIPLNFNHLQQRIREFNGTTMSKEEFLMALKQRLAATDIDRVKQDVMPFLHADPQSLNIWSNAYFLQLADMIKFSNSEME